MTVMKVKSKYNYEQALNKEILLYIEQHNKPNQDFGNISMAVEAPL